MPALLKICLLKEKCHWQKTHYIGRYYSKSEPIPVILCKFNDNCSQQRIVSVSHAKKIFSKQPKSNHAFLQLNVKKRPKNP
jgi:hypothetical protein